MLLRTLSVITVSVILTTSMYAQNFTVHEWGTFTTLSGSNGKLLSGLYIDEEPLPDFTYNFQWEFVATATSRPGKYCDVTYSNLNLENVTVKMETPVIYFYSEKQVNNVTINVQFPGGSISQWYPERYRGEAPQAARCGNASPHYLCTPCATNTLDFKTNRNGWIEWKGRILAPRSGALTHVDVPKLWEAPRRTRSNIFEGSETGFYKGSFHYEQEKYLFYRGIGNFDIPIKTEISSNNRLVISNTGDYVPYYLVWHKQGSKVEILGTGSLEEGCTTSVPLNNAKVPFKKYMDEQEALLTFENALVTAGLYRDEARSMLATWEESYFHTNGLKVFWILPKALTEETLPLHITPGPTNIQRVLVGRNEVLTPQFEAQLLQDFTTGKQDNWEEDRFYEAYKERVEQLKAGEDRLIEEIPAPCNTSTTSAPIEFSVYPNPCKDIIHISANSGSEKESCVVKVMSIQGKQLIVEKASINELGQLYGKVDVSSLTPGVYLLSVQEPNTRRLIRFVKHP